MTLYLFNSNICHAEEQHCSTNERFNGLDPEVLSWRPRVLLYRNFISEEENAALRALQPRLRQSKIALQRVDSKVRLSEMAVVHEQELRQTSSPLLNLRRKAAAESRLSVDHFEALQLQRYNASFEQENAPGHYSPHPDTNMNAIEDMDRVFGDSRRAATWIFYLSDDFVGGETVFINAGRATDLRRHANVTGRQLINEAKEVWPDAYCGGSDKGLQVKPEKNSAVLFYNLLPTGEFDIYSVHGSCPIVSGGPKLISQQWIREAPYEPLLSPELMGIWPLNSFNAEVEDVSGKWALLPSRDSWWCTVGMALNKVFETSMAMTLLFWINTPKPSEGECRSKGQPKSNTVIRLVGAEELMVEVDSCTGIPVLRSGGKALLSGTAARPGRWVQWALIIRKEEERLEAAFVRDASTKQREYAEIGSSSSQASQVGAELCVSNQQSVHVAEMWLWAGLPDDAQLVWLWSSSERRLPVSENSA